MASKIYEADPIPANELINFFETNLEVKKIVKMESEVLQLLNYDLNYVLLVDYVDVLAMVFDLDIFEYITLAFFSEILQFSIGGQKWRYNFELISGAIYLILSKMPNSSEKLSKLNKVTSISDKTLVYLSKKCQKKLKVFIDYGLLKETYLKYKQYLTYCEEKDPRGSLVEKILGSPN